METYLHLGYLTGVLRKYYDCNMSRTVLQVPINPTLRKEAEKEALKQGFSSLQDAVRFLLNKLAKGVLSFEVDETVQLSPKAIRRYEKMTQDIKSGKAKTVSFSNVDDMMNYLNK